MGQQQLEHSIIKGLIQAQTIADLSYDELLAFFRSEGGMESYLPDGSFSVDPRGKERIIFHPARAKRPQDNKTHHLAKTQADSECIVCKGLITRIVDIAPLSLGYTFINKNLYPSFFPITDDTDINQRAFGFHFLQWTSTVHHVDWHNMPLIDAVRVMTRLAVLEKKLLSFAKYLPQPQTDSNHQAREEPAIPIIKNFGHLVGGSIAHGHQQIVLSNLLPKRQQENLQFLQNSGMYYSAYMLQQTPPDYVIKDYGNALLIVPPTMKRPYEMLLLMKDTSRQYIHQLDYDEIESIAQAWADGIRTIRQLLPELGRPTAFNIITHNGAGAGLYFEFLPYTQELGGFEQLGLYVCQSNPSIAADHLRSILNG